MKISNVIRAASISGVLGGVFLGLNELIFSNGALDTVILSGLLGAMFYGLLGWIFSLLFLGLIELFFTDFFTRIPLSIFLVTGAVIPLSCFAFLEWMTFRGSWESFINVYEFTGHDWFKVISFPTIGGLSGMATWLHIQKHNVAEQVTVSNP